VLFRSTLFMLKNYVLNSDLPIESMLPFGIPAMPYSRLAQVTSPLSVRLENNFWFLLTGFQSGNITQAMPDISPALTILFPLAIVGAAYSIRRYRKSRQADLFFLWLGASAILLIPWDLTVARVNAVFIPMIVVGVYGLVELYESLNRNPRAQTILALGVSVLLAIQSLVFVLDYFGSYGSVKKQLPYLTAKQHPERSGVLFAA